MSLIEIILGHTLAGVVDFKWGSPPAQRRLVPVYLNKAGQRVGPVVRILANDMTSQECIQRKTDND